MGSFIYSSILLSQAVSVYCSFLFPSLFVCLFVSSIERFTLFARCRAIDFYLPTIFLLCLPNAFKVNHALMYLSIVKSGIFVQHRAR